MLEAGVREQFGRQRELFAFIDAPDALAALALQDRLETVARAALARLASERDLNRIVLRDLEQFPELLEFVRTEEMQRIQAMLAHWLSAQSDSAQVLDWDAVASVLMGSVSHFWLLRDVMGTHPAGLEEERFVSTLAEVAARMLEPAAT